MRLPLSLAIIGMTHFAASIAAAQEVSTLVLEGDVIASVGIVTRVDKLWINGSGDYMVKVTTNNPDHAANEVLLMNGLVHMVEGQGLTNPSGSSLLDFDSMCINNTGFMLVNIDLGGRVDDATDSGICWNGGLVIQKGDLSSSTAFSPSTPYVRFDEVRSNDNDQIVVIGAVDDDQLPTAIDACITVFDVDASGNVVAESVVKKEADLVGTSVSPITVFGSTLMHYDFNNAGQVMYKVHMATGAGANDVAIYLESPPYTGTGTLIAEEASPSPIADRNWSTLINPAMGLNNNGDWVFKGYLDGSNTDNHIILKNNLSFVRKGDVMASTGGYQIQNFGIAPVEIADNGNVVWYGDWDDPNTSQDTGIFLNHDLFIQEGVTTVGTATIKKLYNTAQGHHISDSGLHIIFKADLDNGLEGAFLIGTIADCNDNGIPDSQDITNGPSSDCNSNGEPDECDIADDGALDCDGDGTLDSCEIDNDPSLDQNNNETLDSCECFTSNFCLPSENSSGTISIMGSQGSLSIASNDFALMETGAPPLKMGAFFYGVGQYMVPFGDGTLCVSTPLQRIQPVQLTDEQGAAALAIDFTQEPFNSEPFAVTPFSTWYFQFWHRDPPGGPAGFNFSDGLKVTFCP